MRSTDELFMQRAFDLAARGQGHVSPNPLVGCVIVKENTVIGEGWHQKFGGPHAEVNAVNSVQNRSDLSGATVYVNLEPCSHYGKTPPCADLLVSERVGRVVISNIDPNPLVQGKGSKKLREAGIEVSTGVLEDYGRRFNIRFFTFITKKRPYVILKWAQTSDGFIARENFDSKWISNEYSRQLVHRWRSEEDAVLVGKTTAMHDNPKLNVRDWSGRDPVRIVIDQNLSLPDDLHLFDKSQPTICYNLRKDDTEGLMSYARIQGKNIVSEICADLFSRNIQSVIVEGGTQTINKFLANGLWDEARIFTSPQKFQTGIKAPRLSIMPTESQEINGDRLDLCFNAD